MASERGGVDALLGAADEPHLSLRELLTLGLCVSRKWDRARAANPAAKQASTTVSAAGFDSLTAAARDGFRATASRTLAEYAAGQATAGHAGSGRVLPRPGPMRRQSRSSSPSSNCSGPTW